MHHRLIWEETGFEVIAVSDEGKRVLPLGKRDPRSAPELPRTEVPSKASRATLPTLPLWQPDGKTVSKYKAISTDRGVRPRPAATEPTVEEVTSVRDTLPCSHIFGMSVHKL